MVNFYFDEDLLIMTIALEGKLTIESLEELKNSFANALDKASKIVLEHSKADEFDFSYLQLLLSVILTTNQLNKKLSIVKGNPEEFKKIVTNPGFDEISPFTEIFLN